MSNAVATILWVRMRTPAAPAHPLQQQVAKVATPEELHLSEGGEVHEVI